MPPLKTMILAGVIVGGVLYLVMLRRAKKRLDLLHMVEVMGAGALLLGAVHLGGCAFDPSHLVHVTDPSGKTCTPPEYHFELSDIHSLEIMSAAFAFFVGSCVALVRFLPYRKDGE